MCWNWTWTQPDWPNFSFHRAAVEPLERLFLLSSGESIGALRYVTGEDHIRHRLGVDPHLTTELAIDVLLL